MKSSGSLNFTGNLEGMLILAKAMKEAGYWYIWEMDKYRNVLFMWSFREPFHKLKGLYL